MAMYEVIAPFTDLRDYDHPYNVGDVFPRQGVVVDQNRLDELASIHNRQRKPLIRLVDEGTSTATPTVESVAQPETELEVPQTTEPESKQPTEGTKKYTKADLEDMSVPKIRELAKSLDFKCSSVSKADIIAEFLEKQG